MQRYVHSGRVTSDDNPLEFAKRAEQAGAGELLLNCIDRDGTMQGYDIQVIRNISNAVKIPVVACGGAGSLKDMKEVINFGGASSAAAGSFFVFHGKHRAVLITYPDEQLLLESSTRLDRLHL